MTTMEILTLIGILLINGGLLIGFFMKLRIKISELDTRLIEVDNRINEVKCNNEAKFLAQEKINDKLDKKFELIDNKLDRITEKINNLAIQVAKNNK